jgi:hypothetical protein
MFRRFGLTRDEECGRILKVYGPDDFAHVGIALDEQFRTIHNRAQLLLGVCGVLISTSVLVTSSLVVGRGYLRFHTAAGPTMLVAGALSLVAAGVLCVAVLRIRFITQQPGEDLRAWVLANLEYRDGKTRAYRASVLLVLASMLSYQCAVTIALVQSP